MAFTDTGIKMRFLLIMLGTLLLLSNAYGLTTSELSNTEAKNGLKAALTQAASQAVTTLSATDGFFANQEVKIALPDSIKKVEKAMRMLGMGKQTDELVLKMNRAAEAAVPEAKSLLVDSVKKMSVTDAKNILTGGDDAATQFFKKTTSAPLMEKFLPIVKKATENVQLTEQYNKFSALGNKFGLVKKEQVNLEQYVTQKTLDGVFIMMAKEELAIRHNPVGQASKLLKKVFGAVAN